MKHNYAYFKRDISWLSFNYRVLMEADDDSLPLYERIHFIAIYSSNLEEFYKVRVAEHRAVASGGHSDDMTPAEAHELIHQITREVNIQLEERIRIYDRKLIPALRQRHIIFYQSRSELEAPHQAYIQGFFQEEIFPYLQPVPVCRERLTTFLRDNRLYLAARLRRKDTGDLEYFILKLPYSKVPRFIELPSIGPNRYLMFMEDIIKANLWRMFPGYEMDCSYCCKISRDADIFVDDADTPERIVEQLKKKVKKRKIGAVCRFVYDRNMPADFLAFLAQAFGIHEDELVPGDKHLNLEDLAHLPDPDHTPSQKPAPMHLQYLDEKQSIQRYVNHHDLLLHFPYHSFDHFIHFLYEAVHDPSCREIMITQYRVAENSEVIHTLMAAAQNGKRVTVFVELKARFDEENNLATAEMMKHAGIRIIFSIPGLKVHAKVALVLRRNDEGKQLRSYAYISTGNFNEQTAKLYADSGLFTSNPTIVNDLHTLFRVLSREVTEPKFKRLWVARFNLLDELKKQIDYEIAEAEAGREGRIILKMNALQDPAMISELYRASEAGVEIDLIVRGICCLIPGQSYSRHIRVTRIVDMFLEHARVWYFRHGGHEKVYIGSPDWMRRNLYRRIEAVTPILHDAQKQELIQMLRIQLADNQKAGWVDGELRNVLKRNPEEKPVRAQWDFYEYLKGKNHR
jgi:polyphosphate kinase